MQVILGLSARLLTVLANISGNGSKVTFEALCVLSLVGYIDTPLPVSSSSKFYKVDINTSSMFKFVFGD